MSTGKTAATAKRVASKNWGSSVPVMEYGYAARIVGFNVNKQGQPHLIVDISGIEYFSGRVQAINIAKREKAIVPFEAQHWAKGNTWPLFARLVRDSVLSFDIMIARRGDLVQDSEGEPIEGEHGELRRFGLEWNPETEEYEEKDVADTQYRIRNEQIMLSEKADGLLDKHDDTVNAANAKARGGSVVAAPAPSKEEMDELFDE